MDWRSRITVDATIRAGKPCITETRITVRIDKKWIFDSFMLDLYLDVWNVTNRENVEAPDYNFDYSKRKTENGLSIMPILGLRAQL